ncbi:MAG: diguanylate cyclase [Candidatus Goldiibacteriota bacterium HGW-Goldbacteria-1]|nr:MAG: diguanylate cyclase [Candidatus Goldiibacteriota bacterium HGW-Goldbacteria-1]
MKRYIFKRLLLAIPVLFGITVITFFIIHLTPGGFTAVNMQMDIRTSPDSIERMRHLYGLDKPILVQYVEWIGRTVTFNFGESFIDHRPVLHKVAERLPATLLLNVLSLALVFFFGIILGVISAVKRNTAADKIITVFTFIGYSIPTFWLALLLMLFVSVKAGLLPVSGMVSIDFDYMTLPQKIADLASHLILPLIVTSIGGLAYISRFVKSGMIEALSQQYIRAAYAKGLDKKTILYRSALKNSLLPVITLLGMSIPGLIGGSFIFETIFAWPGMGRLAYESALSFDYPVIMGVVTMGAVLTLLGNLAADIAYAAVDPRIRYK